jgi:SPP1 family predicted phage head-tail adaptor
MNLQIDIQAETPTVPATYDSYNNEIKPWSNVTGLTGLWASMITTGGRELYAAQKVHAETSVVFKLRHVTGITTLMQVKYGSRLFNIINVNNVNEKNEYLLLSCKEVV